MAMTKDQWLDVSARVGTALDEGRTDEVADLVACLEQAVGLEPWSEERTPVVVARRFARAHARALARAVVQTGTDQELTTCGVAHTTRSHMTEPDWTGSAAARTTQRVPAR